LECRNEIFQNSEKLDYIMKTIYSKRSKLPVDRPEFKSETMARMSQYFYKHSTEFSISKIWGIKSRSIVHDREEAQEVYALTDSEAEN